MGIKDGRIEVFTKQKHKAEVNIVILKNMSTEHLPYFISLEESTWISIGISSISPLCSFSS